KKMNERIINNIGALKKVEDLARVAISSIKTVEDMERIGELYHVTVEIDYWMECLTANDPFVQFQTLQEVSRSLKRISREVGDKS
ncbi:MAG TPA: hypothetical protein VEY51_12135, partial [Chondromyces sp.]|nr:hypothetical protein [Chondromyces sp.]